MRRVMVICPSPADGTSFYRGIGPFTRLLKSMPDLIMVTVSHVDYLSLAAVDLVFMQRPFRDDHLKAANHIKRHNVPLWIDYDDDLFSVTVDNPTAHMYRDTATQARVRQMIGLADVVTVSTEHLKGRISEFTKKSVIPIVVPNAIDDWQFEHRRPRRVPRPNVVLWRGGPTHQRDLFAVGQKLVDASHHPALADWRFHFQGYNPWWITEKMRHEATTVGQSLEPVEYMRFLEELCPAIMVVPLEKNVFNLSKSNCSWIEGAYAGAMVIAPDMPEFRRPGIVNYDTPDSFGKALLDAMLRRMDTERIAEEGWKAVRRTATLSVVNELREQIIDTVTTRPRGFRA